jgi:hypothetical protein
LFDRVFLLPQYRVTNFTKLTSSDNIPMVEHISRYLGQS